MGLLRRDTPLADTPDPGKGNVTRTEIKNPNGSTTYKMNWNNSSSSSNAKPVTKSSTPVTRSNNTPKVASRVSGSSGSREITTIIPMSKGIVDGENKITATLSGSNLANRGDNRTWQQKRKDEVTKRDYNKYKQEDETVSEWKERAKKESEEVSRKAPDRTSRKVFSRPGSGSGGCKSC